MLSCHLSPEWRDVSGWDITDCTCSEYPNISVFFLSVSANKTVRLTAEYVVKRPWCTQKSFGSFAQ